jgi:hypothetical protein
MISVTMPASNAETFIAEAIESILAGMAEHGEVRVVPRNQDVEEFF